jgi:type I restriction enzyme M protein
LPGINIQQEIVAQIEKEQQLVDANKQLIQIYEQKTKSKIAEIWET